MRPEKAAAGTGRLWHIDHLRVALTALVIAHHVGQAYGPGGWWYIKETTLVPVLSLFFGLNRSFFMSLFFLISGYFLPAAYDRKGARVFLKERLLRLGIPLLVFFFLIIPVMTYTYYTHFRGYGFLPFGQYYLDVYFGRAGQPPDWTGPTWPDLQFGHLWFIEHLLILNVCYALLRFVRERRLKAPVLTERPGRALPSDVAILVFALRWCGSGTPLTAGWVSWVSSRPRSPMCPAT